MRMRTDRELVEQMAGIELLAGFSRRTLARIAAAGQHVHLPPGWTFVHERTPADACYLILHGQARVLVGGVEVARLGPGRLVGERAFIDQRLRSATVCAVERIDLLRLGYDELARLARDYPQLQEAMLSGYRSNLPAAATESTVASAR